MKSQFLLLALIAAAFSSCTTAYKTGQTPDDVYFSPPRAQDEYVRVDKKEEPTYQSRDDYYDDRYLRMRVHNRMQWSELDDYYYYGNRYDYSYYNSFYWSNPWSPCSYWNSHYNPYYQSYVVITPKSPVFNHPRTVNLNTYNSTMLTNSQYSNPNNPKGGTRPLNSYTPSNTTSSYHNTNSGAGNFLRNVFNSGSGGNSGSSGNSGSRSSSSSSSSSGGSSSGGHSGGGSAPVRRF